MDGIPVRPLQAEPELLANPSPGLLPLFLSNIRVLLIEEIVFASGRTSGSITISCVIGFLVISSFRIVKIGLFPCSYCFTFQVPLGISTFVIPLGMCKFPNSSPSQNILSLLFLLPCLLILVFGRSFRGQVLHRVFFIFLLFSVNITFKRIQAMVSD